MTPAFSLTDTISVSRPAVVPYASVQPTWTTLLVFVHHLKCKRHDTQPITTECSTQSQKPLLPDAEAPGNTKKATGQRLAGPSAILVPTQPQCLPGRHCDAHNRVHARGRAGHSMRGRPDFSFGRIKPSWSWVGTLQTGGDDGVGLTTTHTRSDGVPTRPYGQPPTVCRHPVALAPRRCAQVGRRHRQQGSIHDT